MISIKSPPTTEGDKTIANLPKRAMRTTVSNRIATCRRCKTTRRIHVQRRRWYDRPKPGFFGETIRKERVRINGMPDFDTRASALLLCCAALLSFTPVRGRVTGRECGETCLSAKSGYCECSCGGENHGKNHC